MFISSSVFRSLSSDFHSQMVLECVIELNSVKPYTLSSMCGDDAVPGMGVWMKG